MDQEVRPLPMSGYAKKQKKYRQEYEIMTNFALLPQNRTQELNNKSEDCTFKFLFEKLWQRQKNKNPNLRNCLLGLYALLFESSKVVIKMWNNKESICYVQVISSDINLKKRSRVTLHTVLTFAVKDFLPDKTLDEEERKKQKRLHTFLRMVLERQDRLVS